MKHELIARLRAAGDDEAADEIEALSSHLERARRADARSPSYRQGQRNAQTWAVEWLHRRAQSMNDPSARLLLNGAAFELGICGKQRFWPAGPNEASD